MAKKIEWSERAELELFEILEYWSERNQSQIYSLTLQQLLFDNIEPLVNFPESGRVTKFPNVRIKVVQDYLIYYRISETIIEIVTIWDNRRDPKKFKL